MTESNAPQGSLSLDPFEMWRKYYEANEQAWTKAMKDVTTTRDYAEAQGKMLETFLSFQKVMRDGMTTQLNNLNLPTRDDVARSTELVIGVEEKVDQLEETISSLEDKVGHLDARLANLEGKLGQVSQRLPGLETQLKGLENSLGKKLDDKVGQLGKQLEGIEQRLTKQFQGTERSGVVGNGVESAPRRTPRAVARPTRSKAGGGAPAEKAE